MKNKSELNLPEELTFDEYQELSWKTAEYPDVGNNVIYSATGLIGELGELAGKTKKIFRDANGILTGKHCKMIKGEISDVLWYIAACCNELKISWGEICKEHLNNIDKENLFDNKTNKLTFTYYEKILLKKFEFEKFSKDLKNRIDVLSVRACKSGADISDMLIDFGMHNKDEKEVINIFTEKMQDLMIKIFFISRHIGLNINEIAKYNLHKLSDRAKRGKIKGDGDER